MDKKKAKLIEAQDKFIAWLDGCNYSGKTKCCPHYALIEGVKSGKSKRVSFILNWIDPEPYVVINSHFPKSEQNLSIDQFYEWMNSPEKQNDNFLQQF